jgi:hypothetical protein
LGHGAAAGVGGGAPIDDGALRCRHRSVSASKQMFRVHRCRGHPWSSTPAREQTNSHPGSIAGWLWMRHGWGAGQCLGRLYSNALGPPQQRPTAALTDPLDYQSRQVPRTQLLRAYHSPCTSTHVPPSPTHHTGRLARPPRAETSSSSPRTP